MPAELWGLSMLALFYLGVQLSLGRARARDLDQARMLPFADDPEVARRVEHATRRSTSGCACPGTCDGRCEHLGRQTF